jgi:hypothetical protein
MSVETTDRKIEFQGPISASTVVAIPFRFLNESDNRDLKARTYPDDDINNPVELVYGVGFTATGGDPNGNATINIDISTGQNILFYREEDDLQRIEYEPNDDFPEKSHEKGLDKLTMICQEMREDIARSLTQSLQSPGTDILTIPESEDGKYLGWVNNVLSNLDGPTPVEGRITRQIFDVVGSPQSVFTITEFTVSDNEGIEVFVKQPGGERELLKPGTDFNITATDQLTVTTPVAAGGDLTAWQVTELVASGNNFTGVGSDASNNPTNTIYDLGFNVTASDTVDVFINKQYMVPGVDYNKSASSQITTTFSVPDAAEIYVKENVGKQGADGPKGDTGAGITASVADTTALKAIDTTNAADYPDKSMGIVEAEGIYLFDRDSVEIEDLPEIVAPTTGVGRWKLQTMPLGRHNNTKDIQGGTANEYYHLTVAQLNILNALNDTTVGAPGMEQIGVSALGSSDILDLYDLYNKDGSTGLVNGTGVVSDGGSGTVDITEADIFVRTTDSNIGELVTTKVAAVTGFSLTDNSNNFIYASYNGGTPAFTVSTTPLTDFHRNVIVAVVYREGTTLHITNINIQTSQTAQQLSRRLVFVDGIVKQSGGIVSEVGTRNIAITQGSFWLGLTDFTLSAIDTSVSDTFSTYYYNGSAWVETTGQTQIDNTQYNDTASGLATLPNNRYGVHWVYRGLDGDTYVVYGDNDYSLTEAENATTLANVPPHISIFHGVLVAKIIIQKNAATFTEIEDPFATVFQPGTPSNHGDLGNLLNDDHTQYVLADGTRNITGPQILEDNLEVQGQCYLTLPTTKTPSGTTETIDWNDGNVQVIDLTSATGTVALTLNNPKGGGSYQLKFIQGATARNVSLPIAVKMDNGNTAPHTLTLPTVNDSVSAITLTYYSDSSTYIATFSGVEYK